MTLKLALPLILFISSFMPCLADDQSTLELVVNIRIPNCMGTNCEEVKYKFHGPEVKISRLQVVSDHVFKSSKNHTVSAEVFKAIMLPWLKKIQAGPPQTENAMVQLHGKFRGKVVAGLYDFKDEEFQKVFNEIGYSLSNIPWSFEGKKNTFGCYGSKKASEIYINLTPPTSLPITGHDIYTKAAMKILPRNACLPGSVKGPIKNIDAIDQGRLFAMYPEIERGYSDLKDLQSLSKSTLIKFECECAKVAGEETHRLFADLKMDLAFNNASTKIDEVPEASTAEVSVAPIKEIVPPAVDKPVVDAAEVNRPTVVAAPITKPVEPPKVVVAPIAKPVEPPKAVVAPIAKPVEPPKVVVAPIAKPVEPPKAVVAPIAKPVEPPKAVVATIAKPVEPPKVVVAPIVKPVEPPKVVFAPVVKRSEPPKEVAPPLIRPAELSKVPVRILKTVEKPKVVSPNKKIKTPVFVKIRAPKNGSIISHQQKVQFEIECTGLKKLELIFRTGKDHEAEYVTTQSTICKDTYFTHVLTDAIRSPFTVTARGLTDRKTYIKDQIELSFKPKSKKTRESLFYTGRCHSYRLWFDRMYISKKRLRSFTFFSPNTHVPLETDKVAKKISNAAIDDFFKIVGPGHKKEIEKIKRFVKNRDAFNRAIDQAALNRNFAPLRKIFASRRMREECDAALVRGERNFKKGDRSQNDLRKCHFNASVRDGAVTVSPNAWRKLKQKFQIFETALKSDNCK